MSGTDEVSRGPAVLAECHTAGSLLWVAPDGLTAGQMASGCTAGVAVMPLAGPAVLVTALAEDARTLRQRLRLPDGPGLPAAGSVPGRPVPVASG